MPVMISMLRGVNVGGHNLIKMDALRVLYESLGLRDAQTYVQSGNVVFRTKVGNPVLLSKKIEDGIERGFGFRPSVVVRSASEMRDVIRRNPFAKRAGIEPAKLVVTFFANDPGAEARAKIMSLQAGPEEVRVDGREVYVYFPDGMGKSKLWPLIEKTLKAMTTPGTGRNWNTVMKLVEMAESL
jgi:uncharacterized protein (DUF1697 family)